MYNTAEHWAAHETLHLTLPLWAEINFNSASLLTLTVWFLVLTYRSREEKKKRSGSQASNEDKLFMNYTFFLFFPSPLAFYLT